MNIPEFKSGDEWQSYTERLEQFFKLNETPENKKSPLLLTGIDSKTYQLLRDICQPLLPKDKTFDELINVLNKHYIIKVAVFRERTNFYRLRQYPNERIADFFARIKKHSVKCQFEDNLLDDILRDRFISGLYPSPALDRLCEEDEELSLEEAVNIASSKESAMNLSSNNQSKQYQNPTSNNNNNREKNKPAVSVYKNDNRTQQYNPKFNQPRNNQIPNNNKNLQEEQKPIYSPYYHKYVEPKTFNNLAEKNQNYQQQQQQQQEIQQQQQQRQQHQQQEQRELQRQQDRLVQQIKEQAAQEFIHVPRQQYRPRRQNNKKNDSDCCIS